MGLECSHDAFHGAYSAFNTLRQAVCHAMGGSCPPHIKRDEKFNLVRDENGEIIWLRDLNDFSFSIADEFEDKEKYAGLWVFLTHSDCDGEISPEMCKRVADELEKFILPKLKHYGEAPGHIGYQGGYAKVLKKFIKGCRKAHQAGEPLEFY